MKKKLIITIIIIISLFQFISGIKWGLPSKERNKFYFTDDNQIKQLFTNYNYDKLQNSMTSVEKSKSTEFYNAIRSYHADESIFLKSVSNLNPKKLKLNPHLFWWGSLYIYLLAITWGIAGILNYCVLSFNLEFFFLNPEEIAKFYLLGRLLSTTFAIGTGYIVYKLTLKIYKNYYTALLAFFFYTIIPLISIYAKIMYADHCSIFFAVLAMWFLFDINTENILKQKNYILFGIFSGLAISAKYTAGLIWCQFFLYLIIKIIESKIDINKKKILINIFKSIVFASLVFIVTNPYAILSSKEFFSWFFRITQQYSDKSLNIISGHYPYYKNGFIFFIETCFYNFGWFQSFLLIFAIIYLFKNRHIEDFILLSIFIVYFIFFSLSKKRLEHYLMLSYPFLAIFIAKQIITFFQNEKKLLVKIIIILMLLSGLYFTTSINLYLTNSKNNRELVSQYIINNIPEGSVIGVYDPYSYWSVPINESKYSIIPLKYTTYQLDKINYFIISQFEYNNYKNDKNIKYFFSKKDSFKIFNYPKIFGIDIKWPQFDLAQNLFPLYYIIKNE